MSNAYHDENGRPTIICASKNDGKTIVPILANPTSHRMLVSDATTGSDGSSNAMLDENGVAVWTALASDGSGNIIEVYGDPATGNVLINSL